MEKRMMQVTDSTADLVRAACEMDGPVVVFDGDDECLVVMRPAVFERILCSNEELSRVNRMALHF